MLVLITHFLCAMPSLSQVAAAVVDVVAAAVVVVVVAVDVAPRSPRRTLTLLMIHPSLLFKQPHVWSTVG